jgi:hypothetical protein
MTASAEAKRDYDEEEGFLDCAGRPVAGATGKKK